MSASSSAEPPPSAEDWPAAPDAPDGPLWGLRVLDLSRVLAGPFATMLRGDFGADVLKVESPEGDATRHRGPPFLDATAAFFFVANRNKRSVVLDLERSDDLASVRRLTAAADVVVDNFRAESAARFGLGYEQIAERNPDCVVCTITGFARGSDRDGDPAYDLVIQAAGGMMGITGIDGMPRSRSASRRRISWPASSRAQRSSRPCATETAAVEAGTSRFRCSTCRSPDSPIKP